jgi:hypothetical protein
MIKLTYAFLLISLVSKAQEGNANVNNSTVTRETLLARSGYVSPLETKGSPFLYTEYKKARIANNQKLVDMRYNAYKDEVEIINNGRNMTIFKNNEYSPIQIIDSDEKLYLLEYPYQGKKVLGYLFEVKKIENITILMRISKGYDKGKYAIDSFDRSKENMYDDLPDIFYFQKQDGVILQMPKTRDELIKMFPEKKHSIELNIKDKKLNTKNLNLFSQLFIALS